MSNSRVQSLLGRNEQLAHEIMRVRSKYSRLKRECHLLRSILLTHKISRGTQTDTYEHFTLPRTEATQKLSPREAVQQRRVSLLKTYTSPAPFRFPRTPNDKRQEKTTTPTSPHRANIVSPSRQRLHRRYETFSDGCKRGVEVLHTSPNRSSGVVSTTITGERLDFEDVAETSSNDDDKVVSPLNPQAEYGNFEVAQERIAYMEESRNELYFQEKLDTTITKLGRRSRGTPISYKEPSLRTKIRKGHTFFNPKK